MNICHQIVEHQTTQIQARKIVKNSRKLLLLSWRRSRQKTGAIREELTTAKSKITFQNIGSKTPTKAENKTDFGGLAMKR